MTNELTTTTITNAQVAILTQSTPREVIKKRKGRGGKMLSYVSHDYVTRTLNEAFAFQWTFQIVSERIVPDEAEPREVIVRGRLTIHTPNGDLVKEQFGGSDVKRTKKGDIISLADDLKSAGSDALKKCASLLGLALDLYGSGQPQNGRPKRANWNLDKVQFFAKSRQDFSLTNEQVADMLKSAGYTNGYDKSKAQQMYEAVKLAVDS